MTPRSPGDRFRLLRTYHLALLVPLWLLPGIVLSAMRVTDGFLYLTASLAEVSVQSGHINFETGQGYNYGRHDWFPGYPALLAVLREVTGMPMVEVIYLPLGGALLAGAYYALARRLTGSVLVASLLSLYAATDFTLAHHYNVFAYSWAFPLYLLFLATLHSLYRQESAPRAAVLLGLFVSVMSLHYAVSLWMVAAIIGTAGIVATTGLGGRRSRNAFAGLAALMTVAYFTYNRVFYELWLPRIAAGSGLEQSASTFLAKVLSYLTRENETPERYAATATFGEAFGLLRIVEYLLILSALLVGLGLALRATRRTGGGLRERLRPWLLPAIVLATAVAETIAYSAHGWVPVKYVILSFPVAAIGLLTGWSLPRGRALAASFSAGLAALAVVGFLIASQTYAGDPLSSDAKVGAAGRWTQDRAGEEPTVLSDLETSGRLLLDWATRGTHFKPEYYDDKLYGALVNAAENDSRLSGVDYVVLDVRASENGVALHGVAERNYLPLSPYLDQIALNPRLSAVYSSGDVRILVPEPGLTRAPPRA